jgi:hypothetical protein
MPPKERITVLKALTTIHPELNIAGLLSFGKKDHAKIGYSPRHK